jgi:type VI secretion system secreted protein VgrG
MALGRLAGVQRDYTFKNPPHHLQHRHSAGTRNGVADAYPIYDYPGRYKHDDSGKPFTRAKLEATRVDASTGEGVANAPHLRRENQRQKIARMGGDQLVQGAR